MSSTVDLFIQKRLQLVSSSFVGLFWFDNEYSEIVDIRGDVEFTETDILGKHTVLPKGSHTVYRIRRFDLPRGRVELNNGIPAISVGEKCPDSVIELVIKFMGLAKYRNFIDIRRSSFWDKK